MHDPGSKPATSRRSSLRRFLVYVAPHKWYIAGAAAAGVVKFGVPLTFPLALKYLTDVVLGGSTVADSEPTNVWIEAWCANLLQAVPWLGEGGRGRVTVVVLSLLALYVAAAVAAFYRSYWAGQARQRMIFDLRYALFQHVQGMSHSFFEERRSGAIVSRFVSDIQRAQQFVGSALTNVWMDGIALGFVVWILFLLEPRLAVVALAVMPLYVGLTRYFAPRIKAASSEVQEMVEDFSGDLQEKIAGATVVKAFAQEQREARRFYTSTRTLMDRMLHNVALSSANQASAGFLTGVAPVLVIWTASVMVLHGTLTIGTMIAVYAYLGSLYLPLQRFSELGVVVSNSLAAMERIFEFFDIRPEVCESPQARALPAVLGRVSLRDVGFAYAARRNGPFALEHITLDVEPGEKIAVVGRSGAGKSTLVSLIPRFYDVTAGTVCIDGADVRDLTLASLRAHVGIVPQDPILFSGTLQENLLYGKPDATEEELLAAARAAHVHSFARTLSDGYLTLVGERGVHLSGGSAHPHPRRSDSRSRLGIGKPHSRRPAPTHGRAHNVHHRTPPLDGNDRGPHRRSGTGATGGNGLARRAHGARRCLPSPVRATVEARGRGVSLPAVRLAEAASARRPRSAPALGARGFTRRHGPSSRASATRSPRSSCRRHARRSAPTRRAASSRTQRPPP
jgi:subfamily B ATP-binding cassette protein MsbA